MIDFQLEDWRFEDDKSLSVILAVPDKKLFFCYQAVEIKPIDDNQLAITYNLSVGYYKNDFSRDGIRTDDVSEENKKLADDIFLYYINNWQKIHEQDDKNRKGGV